MAAVAILAALLDVIPFDANAQNLRVLGLDISAWQGNISQTTWNNIHNVENRQFIFLRASRGGTTGYYDQNDSANANGLNTLSQRYDDPYFVQNINRVTTASMYAGPYHFSRPDIIESTQNSGGIRNTGTNEAHHFIQMAGAWMRPGYLIPVHDLEAGISQTTSAELTQFAIDFSDYIFTNMGIRPAVYINGSYAADVQSTSATLRNLMAQPPSNLPSVTSPAYPYLWTARWPNQSDPNSIDVQNTEPNSSLSTLYGPWDDYGTAQPWKFWQYASTIRLTSYNNGGSNLDADVARGGIEFLKDQLVPAVWWNDSSGDWGTLANWNSGQTPVAPVTGTNQVSPVGTQTLPTARLPGTSSGLAVTSGTNDTVILERTNAAITVTLSSGAYNIRKLYMREALDITGGSLTINYVPSWDSTTNGAQFSGPVSLSGNATMSVHILQVDASQTFTVSGGTLTFARISLMPGGTPAKIALNGNVSISALTGGTNTIVSGTGSGASGKIDLGGGDRTLTVGSGTDSSIDVPVQNGALTKAGSGTLRLTSTNTYAGGTTISAGKLFVNNTSGSGTGTGSVTVNAGILGGSGTISGSVTVNSGGTIAPGTDTSTGTLTLSSAPVLGGTNFFKVDGNNGSPSADKLTRSGGSLTFGGKLVVTNAGAPLTGGEQFTIFSATAYSGNFTATNLPTLNSGLNWYLNDLGVNGTIKVNRSPAVNGFTTTNIPAQTVQIAKASLIGSATDADSDSLTLAGFDAVTTNGIVLSSDSTYIFYSNNMNVADQFTYTISDGHGGSTVGTVQIAVNPSVAPAIISGPSSATIISGQNVTFTVSATGTQPLSYQWKKGGNSLSDGGNISGATSSALTLNNAATSDAANYSVVITNTIGSVTSSAATLTVNYSLNVSGNGPGSVSKNPDQSSFAPEATVTLTATPNAGSMFVNWSGDETSTENPLTITMTSNKTLVANFINVGSVSDIIIDNSDSLSVTLSGNWQTGTPSTDKYGADYYFASTVSGGTSNVTYTPTILTAGNYDVYIWYPQGNNRPTNALWSVVYNGGSTNISVNQTNNGGKWVLISSSRPFALGTSGYTRVSNDSVQTSKVVMADAVKFVYSAVQGLAPIITNQPQNQTVLAGQNAIFSVGAAGDPASYQWRFNGVNISGAITSSYTRTSCQSSDVGTYSVVLTNDSGLVTSSDAVLTVNIPAFITTNPSDRTVVAGSNVLFSVVAGGTAPLRYQWKFNGANLSSATASSYTASNAQPGNAGSYSVVVTNDYGTATSLDAVLVVNVPPSISVPPQTQTAIQSSNVIFSVGATGTAPLSYQWRLNTTPLSGATASSYTRVNAQPGDAGSYSVVVTNVAGTITSADAVLTVNIPASITTGPLSQSIIQTSNAVFSVIATGTAPLSYAWRRNGAPISGATASSYTRSNVQTADAGSYSVVVTNSCGSATSATAILSVIVPPAITVQPANLAANENGSATFSVSATGTAPISYQWRLNNINILDATDSTYFIESVQSGDFGTYSVVITNAGGSIISSDALLTASPAPGIITQPISQLARAGTNVTFLVNATGSNLEYQWRFNGTNLASATGSSHTLLNVQTANAGSYSVVVSNLSGTITSSPAVLTVDGVAPILKITFPMKGQRLIENVTATNYATTLKGTASDDRQLVQVLYSMNLGVSFQPVTGMASWTAPVTLVPGTNTAIVKAIDAAGNVTSLTQSFVYVVPSTLTLNIIGDGQVMNASGTALEVGRGYRLTAFVGTGTNSIFTNWTRVINNATNFYSSSAILNFTMETNLALNANFIVNPFVQAEGTYNGLFYDSNAVTHASAGFFTVKVARKLTYTGKIQIDGDSVPFSGKFSLPGSVTTTISRTNLAKNNLTLSMALDFTNWSERILGTISDTNWSATLQADRYTWSASNPAITYSNKYTVLIPGLTNPPAQAPTGSGYMLASVSALGKVSIMGATADGHILSQTVAISKNGEWPFYVPLYKQERIFPLNSTLVTNTEFQGCLVGRLTFATNTPAGKTTLAPQGRVGWIKESWTNNVYPSGFAGSALLQSSRFVRPATGTPMFNFTGGSIILSNGNLTGSFGSQFYIGSDNRVLLFTPTQNKLKFTLTATSGLLSGSFVHPLNTNLTAKILGVVLEDYNYGRGFFIGTNQTGVMLLNGN